MNRIIRAFLVLNLGLVAVTCFTFCAKEPNFEPNSNQALNQNELADERKFPNCTLSYTSDVWISACGTRSNATQCTDLVTGAVLTGYTTGFSGTFGLPFNALVSFKNPSGVDAHLTVDSGGLIYNVVIPAGESIGAQLYSNCRVVFVI